VALRAAGLSVESLAAVQVVIDHARRLEGLEADSGAAGPGADAGAAGRDGDQPQVDGRDGDQPRRDGDQPREAG
jgi:hypothetical protein